MVYKTKKREQKRREQAFYMFAHRATNLDVKQALNLEEWELKGYRKQYMNKKKR